MDDRVWKNISIGLGVICALLIGAAGVILAVGHKPGTPQDTSGPSATIIAAGPSVSSGTSGPSITTSPGTPAPNTTPTIAPGTAAPATVTFSNLALDSANDVKAGLGFKRTFTFQSNGPGAVVPYVTKISTNGYVQMCLSVDGSTPNCPINRPGKGLTIAGAKADKSPNSWTVTLVGYKASRPTVTVSFTWPTSAAKITLAHGRFQGNLGKVTSASDALGGLTATFKPRDTGTLDVQATWTIVSTDATMTLQDVSATPAVMIDERKFAGVDHITPEFTSNVDATKTYQVKLVRTSVDSTDRPHLTAEISFP